MAFNHPFLGFQLKKMFMDNKKIIINVGRQLGSGGLVIARKLAEDFGCSFYDKELLNLAAKESGFSEKFFEQNDEKKGFFRSLFHIHAPFMSDNNFYNNKLSQESLFQFQSDAIRKAAEAGSCVFVGRCADYVLRDFDNRHGQYRRARKAHLQASWLHGGRGAENHREQGVKPLVVLQLLHGQGMGTQHVV